MLLQLLTCLRTTSSVGLYRRARLLVGIASFNACSARLGATADEPIGLLLSGELGMGKSRFVQEVIAHAGTSIAWIEIACNARRADDSIAPLRDWLDDSDSRELPTDSLIAATDRLSETSTIPVIDANCCFADLMKLFAHAPRVGLIIEDVHWADLTTIEFIVEISINGHARSFLRLNDLASAGK